MERGGVGSSPGGLPGAQEVRRVPTPPPRPPPPRPGRRRRQTALLLAGCTSGGPGDDSEGDSEGEGGGAPDSTQGSDQGGGTFTLAFAGDVHFQGRRLTGLLGQDGSTLGPLSDRLADADLAMVNLETALAEGGERADKSLEDSDRRYWFRAPPSALSVLERSGVDVATMANNHGADHGAAGLEETLTAAEDAPVALVGVGADAEAAYAPFRTTIDGTDVAVLAADAAPRESEDPVWAAGEGDGPGIAAAREDPPEELVAAVEDAASQDDLVVVYLHWGRSRRECPTRKQRQLARTMAESGADVVVGSHAHVLLGAGMLGDTYVAYGLGDFLWYHGNRPRTGVLTVEVQDGRVVSDDLAPGRIPAAGGQPRALSGGAASDAVSQWRDLRGCTGLEPVGGSGGGSGGGSSDGGADAGGDLPAYEAEVTRIDDELRRRMRSSHDPGRCPVALSDLRHLTIPYVGFDGEAHRGELVVHADHAEDVVGVFEELYDARWPIRRMELVSEYGGDDDRSMAANNTSAYNCRRVAGQDSWSQHAYGAAVDLNPVQNPYVTGGEVRPPRAQRFASVDRSAGADPPQGVISRGDVVTKAFERIGWTWGASFSEPDYQHFAAP